jgi:hypothetical protein
MRIHQIALSVSALIAAVPALAQDGLQRCRAVTDTAARLACYDALADGARVAAPTTGTAAALVQPARSAVAIPISAAPVAPAAATGEASFGLPEARRPGAVESVESTVPADFSGWGPNSRIRLANGQVWQIIDGTSVALAPGARKVAVKRGVLSSFYLDIEGLNTSPRVRRID